MDESGPEPSDVGESEGFVNPSNSVVWWIIGRFAWIPAVENFILANRPDFVWARAEALVEYEKGGRD